MGVFTDNKSRPIHRWYPFVEGYSSALVERALREHGVAREVFDPFGGSGTTALTTSALGIACSYTEVNPYLSWIAHVKVNCARAGAAHADDLQALLDLASRLSSAALPEPPAVHPLLVVDSKRGFFPAGVAARILGTLVLIDQELDGWARHLARMAVAASLVPSSNMVRRTDLRKRTPSDAPPGDFGQLASAQLRLIVEDTKEYAPQLLCEGRQIGTDARGPYEPHEAFDLVVTSPPYLNGTNYCRNSKLELLALGFITSEEQLEDLRSASVTAGINNVSKRLRVATQFDAVESVISQLAQVTYDQRIPQMVRSYFSDMHAVLAQVRRSCTARAEFWLDIGDSRYSGVNVPTHDLLAGLAGSVGWTCVDTEVLRRRRSYDGSELTQQLLRFQAA